MRNAIPLALALLTVGCSLFDRRDDDEDRTPPPAVNPSRPTGSNPEAGTQTPTTETPRPTGVYSRGYDVAWRSTIEDINRATDVLDHTPLDTVDRVRAGEFLRHAAENLRKMQQYVSVADRQRVEEFAAEAEFASETVSDARGDPGQVVRGLQNLARRVQEDLAPGRVTVELSSLPVPEPPPPPQVAPVTVATTPPTPATTPSAARTQIDTYFDAWLASHDLLVQAVRLDQSAETAFSGVIANLELYQNALPEASSPAVTPYGDWYRNLWSRTDGFRRFSDEFTKQDALAELGRTAQAIQQTKPR